MEEDFTSLLPRCFTMRHAIYLLGVCFFLQLAAADLYAQKNKSAKTAAMLDQSTSELRPAVMRFHEDRESLRRSLAVPTEISATARTRLTGLLRAADNDLAAYKFEKLSIDGRIDLLLLENLIHRELRQLNLEADRQEQVTQWLPFLTTLVSTIETTSYGRAIDAESVAQELTIITKQIESLTKQFEDEEKRPPVKRTVLFRASRYTEQLSRELQQWYKFHHGYDPEFSWWMEKPQQQLSEHLQQYAAFLRKELAGVRDDSEHAIVGDPLGREALLQNLAAEYIAYSPEELIEIGEREFAWCEAEMKKVAEELGYDTWLQALEKIKSLHESPGQQPVYIRELAEIAIQFLENERLITIPPLAKETWRMEMMTPERQLINPFFTGGETITVSFPTSGMSHEQKLMSLRGNNRHFAWATVHHELIPGHHLQQFMNARHRPYRKAFLTPFWLEGWALYWEMLLWDKKFYRGPEDRVGMLFWRSHRAARIIFSLKFHLEQMTPEECVEMLVNRVGHERANAEAEVRRSVQGDYPPLYQAAYMLGGLQLRTLHREIVDSGKMTNRDFHDAVLKENMLPIELLRAKFRNEPPPRNFQASWRFYEKQHEKKNEKRAD